MDVKDEIKKRMYQKGFTRMDEYAVHVLDLPRTSLYNYFGRVRENRRTNVVLADHLGTTEAAIESYFKKTRGLRK